MKDTEKEECEEKREYREPAINHYTLTIKLLVDELIV